MYSLAYRVQVPGDSCGPTVTMGLEKDLGHRAAQTARRSAPTTLQHVVHRGAECSLLLTAQGWGGLRRPCVAPYTHGTYPNTSRPRGRGAHRVRSGGIHDGTETLYLPICREIARLFVFFQFSPDLPIFLQNLLFFWEILGEELGYFFFLYKREYKCILTFIGEDQESQLYSLI